MLALDMANRLNGRQYGNEMTKDEEREAKDANLVVVFGASDDLMEFRGAVHDEWGAWMGGEALFNRNGLVINKCDQDDCPYFKHIKQSAVTIEALWDQDGYSWIYKTAIPHVTFDIFEDDEKYCRGIVFNLADVGA